MSPAWHLCSLHLNVDARADSEGQNTTISKTLRCQILYNAPAHWDPPFPTIHAHVTRCEAAGMDEPLSKQEQEQRGRLGLPGWTPNSLQLAAGGQARSAPGLPQHLESQWPKPAHQAAHLRHSVQWGCRPRQCQGAVHRSVRALKAMPNPQRQDCGQHFSKFMRQWLQQQCIARLVADWQCYLSFPICHLSSAVHHLPLHQMLPCNSTSLPCTTSLLDGL